MKLIEILPVVTLTAMTLAYGCAEVKQPPIASKKPAMPTYTVATNEDSIDIANEKRIKQLYKNMQARTKRIEMLNEIIKYFDEEGEEAIDYNIMEMDDKGIENLYNLCQERKEKEKRESIDRILEAIQRIR